MQKSVDCAPSFPIVRFYLLALELLLVHISFTLSQSTNWPKQQV